VKTFFLITFSALVATFCLSYFIMFEGNSMQLKSWWQELARDSESLPFAPYKTRIIAKPSIITKNANQVILEDQHLFWKGSGAAFKPILQEDGTVKRFVVTLKGQNYSDMVYARVSGAGADLFKLGKPIISKGKIVSLPLEKSSYWHTEPVVYADGDKYPFSGVVNNKFPSGQIIEQAPYLSGMLHGTLKRWNEYGIPMCSEDYLKGKKQGTHIYWFDQANDPDDYRPTKTKNGEIIPTLWIKTREDAKDKFKKNFGSHEANEWIIFKYRSLGGDFPVRLLEHWQDNVRHGLFEGFDKFGNKTFKDEYKRGLRIKHRIFDKTKG
jgi:hypothetical protein